MSFDFIELQKKRIYSQYANKPKALQWFNINPFFGNQFATLFEQIQHSYDIRKLSGERLDVVGRLVGQARDFTAENAKVVVPVAYCSFVDKDDFTSLDALNAVYCEHIDKDDFTSEQAINADYCSPLTMPYEGFLPDNAYRQAIQAKIQKNASDVTIDECILAIQLVLPEGTQVTLNDNFDMSFSVMVLGELDEFSNFALTTDLVINRPQGVRFAGYIINVNFCGDQGTVTECPYIDGLNLQNEVPSDAAFCSGFSGGDA